MVCQNCLKQNQFINTIELDKIILIRENILMGSEFERDWYSHVVDVCALARDLQLLDQGDLTEVGERGITLSG